MQKRLFFLMVTLLTVSLTALAQVTTSGINGKVTLGAANGEVAIGATVQAVHQPSGTRYGAVTNVEGRYSIQGMRTGGPYTVTVSYIGSQTKTFEGISLSLGENYNLQVWLEDDAQQLGEITITGQAGLAASRNGAAETINGSRIAELPSLTHSVADVARINPFVRVSESGAMSIAGSNNRYNAIQIDGAMANDVFGLTSNGANGGQAGTQAFSMETIEQLQVSIAPFDVRQSGFTGGAINAITKSGTNDFHGSVYGYYQDGKMVGNKYEMHDGTESADYGTMTDYTWGATLGGPIVKDKLFFFANYERTNREYDNAYSSKGSETQVDWDLAENLLSTLKKRAAEQGVTYTGSLGTPQEYTYSDKVGLKLDWNINDRHHASLRWSLVDARQNNQTAGAKSLVTNDYAYDFVSKANSLVLELQSRLSDNLSNEFHLSWTSVRDKRNPGLAFPMVSISNVGGGTLNMGNERSSMANALNQDAYTLTDNLTWTIGNHAITLGTHDELYKFGNLFCQDFYGTYYFNSPDDFMNGTIARFRLGRAISSVAGTDRWNSPFKAAQLGFYIQDKWDVTDRFQLTYGLRIDMPMLLDTPLENKEFNVWAQEHGYDLQTNQKISVKPLWSPRLGFRYDVLGNRAVIVRGGVGIFTGRIPFVWLSNSFSNTGVAQFNYDTGSGKGGDKTFIVNQGTIMQNVPSTSQGAPAFAAQTINVFNKDFKFGQQLRADLAVDVTGPLGIKWTVEGIYSKTLNDMIVKKLNIEATGKTWGETNGFNFDNRPMFQTMKNTPNILYLDNVSEGYSYNVSIKAEKNFDFGLDLMASYTYGHSKTVNNGSSSVAASNFQYNYTHKDPNAAELETSNFDVPHQVMASAYQHISWNTNPGRTFDNKTTIGLIYTGNSGAPFSIYTYGDMNGDGVNNDLMFIPTDAQIDQLLAAGHFAATSKFTTEQQVANFKQWLANDEYLSSHRGEFCERNGDYEKWENRLDLHLDHKFGFKVGKEIRYLQIGFDIINFTNMLSKKWGATMSQGGYNYYSPLTISKGKYSFQQNGDYDMRSYSDYYSRWRMQLSAKLTF